MYDAIAMGELLIDFAAAGVDAGGYPSMKANPGGAPANYLVALNKFGFRTAFIGKVGADMFGNLLIKTLRDMGIGTENIVRSEEYFTTLAFVTLDQTGDRDFSFARKHGADVMLRTDEVDMGILDGAKVFHFGALSLTDEPVRSATRALVDGARQRGLCVTFDPNLRKPLWESLDEAREQMLYGLSKADIVKISDEEVDFLWGLGPEQGAAKILEEFDVRLVFVTCGAEGAVYANRNALGRAPGIKGINTVDTTGAGDIFGGSAVSRILSLGKAPESLSDGELYEITSFACAAASLSTTKYGGLNSVPEEAEVLAILGQTQSHTGT